MSVRFGDGEGRLDREVICPWRPNLYSKSLFVADFNGDSVMDLAIIDSDDPSTQMYLGLGNGSLILEDIPRLDPYVNRWAIGDLKEDGRLDRIILSFHETILLLGYDAGMLINRSTYATGSASHPVVIVTDDFNHDQ